MDFVTILTLPAQAINKLTGRDTFGSIGVNVGFSALVWIVGVWALTSTSSRR